jgi:hypothetical protein
MDRFDYSKLNEGSCLDFTGIEKDDTLVDTIKCYYIDYPIRGLICKRLYVKEPWKINCNGLKIHDHNIEVLIIRNCRFDYIHGLPNSLKCLVFINCDVPHKRTHRTMDELICIDTDIKVRKYSYNILIDKKEHINNSRYIHYDEDKDEYSFVPENEV